ncbi:hypothetical protein VTO42DRAFT_6293 [Malbranchea cinnamomea]
MGKKKRSKKNRPLTQEEIWDDSALIQSWEEAVEEYKLYHSIQARGENVEDVLREAEAKEAAEEAAAAAEDDAMLELPSAHPGSIEPDDERMAQSVEQEEAEGSQDDNRSDGRATNQIPAGSSRTFDTNAHVNEQYASVPHMVFGGNTALGQDESLKNLMMAWYFAGYYTGLYEGQQRAQQR